MRKRAGKYFFIWGMALSWIFFFIAFSPSISFSAEKPEKDNSIDVEWVSFEEFISHFQTAAGSSVTLPEVAFKGALRIAPRWRIIMQHYRGTSQLFNGFQASVGDFETRVAYRLDDPKDKSKDDSPGKNLSIWGSWKIWTSTDQFNGVTFQERDEGAGIGLYRSPSDGFSYFYSFGVYPSVRTKTADSVNAFTVEAGPTFRVMDHMRLTIGYRFQTLQTGTEKRNRAQEQGLTVGLRGVF